LPTVTELDLEEQSSLVYVPAGKFATEAVVPTSILAFFQEYLIVPTAQSQFSSHRTCASSKTRSIVLFEAAKAKAAVLTYSNCRFRRAIIRNR
jgi:hypothetical protein